MVDRRCSLTVAVFDPVGNQQRLLGATLYALGCHVHPLTFTVQTPAGSVRLQLADVGEVDVVVWDVSPDTADHCDRFLQLVQQGELGESGVVFTTTHAAVLRASLGGVCADAPILERPYTLPALMQAIGSASEQSRRTDAAAAASR
jgi:hypothetical protein